MGGDHKCPVCQATFTRPQHVARHMRSHTGDRPYKCQYCGDQFARSDLLSRHVNKCHANEKPLPLSGGTRRKGSASASRATTSKQACDQCVQSSLPCDGCNPCSKCVQRKCRCTFVKFHRQTAPAGPGHNVRPNAPVGSSGLVPLPSSSSSSRLPMFPQQPEDDFILGPPPTSSSSGVHTMAETLYNSNSFAFPALYPTEPSSLGTADPVDYASKYRAQAQAELFGPGRSGLGTGLTPLYDPRGGSSAAAAAGAAGWLGWDSQSQQAPHPDSGDAYHGHHHHQHHHQDHGRHADMIPASSGGAVMHDKTLLQQQPPPHYMPMAIPYPGAPGASSARGDTSGGAAAVPTTTTIAPTTAPSTAGSSNGSSTAEARTEYEYDYEYDYDYNGCGTGSDGEASQGGRSSATSSSVHLPLGMGMGMLGQQQQPQLRHQQHQQQRQHPHPNQQAMFDAGYNLGLIPDRSGTASTSSSSSSQQQQQQHDSQGGSTYGGGGSSAYPPHDERQEFSSAFGLMSLDDPNVTAGLAVDGQPFFSDPRHAHNQQQQQQEPGRQRNQDLLGQDMDTPMPMKQEPSTGGLLQLSASGLDSKMAPLPTPSRETDTRELRDFWKQYMRTPLSGPGPAGGSGQWLGDSQGSSTGKGGAVTPYRRPRVASMPSVKTPIVEREHFYSEGQPGSGVDVNVGGERGRERKMGPMSSMRTTLHGNHEDLRSYEAAVLARKAPMNLNLQIRKPIRGRGSAVNNYGARPRSAVDAPTSSISSSLANAFGGPSNDATTAPGSTSHQQQVPPSAPAGRVTFAVKKEDSSSPSILHSRGSSAAVEDSDGGSSNDQDSSRPSFKRLPSQTLGPANSKRAFLGFAEGNADSAKDRQLIGWGTSNPGEPHSSVPSKNPSLAGMSHPDRVVASLSERRLRRMSAPGASSPMHLALPDSNVNPSVPEHKISERSYAAAGVGGNAGVAYAPAAQAGGR